MLLMKYNHLRIWIIWHIKRSENAALKRAMAFKFPGMWKIWWNIEKYIYSTLSKNPKEISMILQHFEKKYKVKCSENGNHACITHLLRIISSLLLIWLYETKDSGVVQTNFLKAVFHKIYLAHSWILCPIFALAVKI